MVEKRRFEQPPKPTAYGPGIAQLRCAFERLETEAVKNIICLRQIAYSFERQSAIHGVIDQQGSLNGSPRSSYRFRFAAAMLFGAVETLCMVAALEHDAPPDE